MEKYGPRMPVLTLPATHRDVPVDGNLTSGIVTSSPCEPRVVHGENTAPNQQLLDCKGPRWVSSAARNATLARYFCLVYVRKAAR